MQLNLEISTIFNQWHASLWHMPMHFLEQKLRVHYLTWKCCFKHHISNMFLAFLYCSFQQKLKFLSKTQLETNCEGSPSMSSRIQNPPIALFCYNNVLFLNSQLTQGITLKFVSRLHFTVNLAFCCFFSATRNQVQKFNCASKLYCQVK